MSKTIKVVISGSFRKHLQFVDITLKKFIKSKIKVLAPLSAKAVNREKSFIYLRTDKKGKSAYVLEKEFIANIKKADFLYVANIKGYVGYSVAAEISTALLYGVPVLLSEKIREFSGKIPNSTQKLFKNLSFAKLSIKEITSHKISSLNLSNLKGYELIPRQRLLFLLLTRKLLNELKLAKIKK